MRYSNQNTKQVARFIPIICAICFCAFSFVYLYLYQPSLLAQEQYVFSHGQTSYNSLFGALFCTFVLFLVGLIFTHYITYPIRLKAVSWIPSFYLLGILTCMHFQEIPSDYGDVKYFTIFLVPLLFMLLLYICRSYPDRSSENGSLVYYLTPNLIILILSFLLTLYIGNTQDLLHSELYMSELQYQGKYEESLSIGKFQKPTKTLTYMRVNALIHNNDLGEHLFNYPISDNSNSLLPPLSDNTFVYNPGKSVYRVIKAVPQNKNQNASTLFLETIVKNDTLKKYQSRNDLLLCSYLVDKNLSKFEALFSERYDSLTSDIPRHYQEAILLKQYITQNEDVYKDNPLYSDFTSFIDLMNNDSLSFYTKTKSMIQYRNTYWYYYYSIK